MQLFEKLIQTTREQVDETVKAMNDRFAEFQAFCVELRSKMDAVQLSGDDGGPDSPLDEAAGEKLLGDMSEDLRRLYVVRCKMHDDMEAECMKAHGAVLATLMETPLNGMVDELDKLTGAANDHNKLHERVELANKIFWTAVAEMFPQGEADHKSQLGLRHGWQVVSAPKRENPRIIIGSPIRIPESLARMFAGLMDG